MMNISEWTGRLNEMDKAGDSCLDGGEKNQSVSPIHLSFPYHERLPFVLS